MILIQFLICGHTARAVCGLKFERMIRRVKETNPSYRASGMWIEINSYLRAIQTGFSHTARAVCGLKCEDVCLIKGVNQVIPRERYVD